MRRRDSVLAAITRAAGIVRCRAASRRVARLFPLISYHTPTAAGAPRPIIQTPKVVLGWIYQYMSQCQLNYNRLYGFGDVKLWLLLCNVCVRVSGKHLHSLLALVVPLMRPQHGVS